MRKMRSDAKVLDGEMPTGNSSVRHHDAAAKRPRASVRSRRWIGAAAFLFSANNYGCAGRLTSTLRSN